ncbi:hypothetical protein PVAG01_04309 [Phlyctema vagabunda]|uniref:Uncharacterized protein n=1 Tax=Phlyctema vagabunda TaxID=108571 RepID=A0ABR4PNT6_9HELO
MCVENVYIDIYPDGRQVEFRQTSICQYGHPNRPCHTLTTLSNPPRYIKYGEITTQQMLTQAFYPRHTHTPPRSSGGSQPRRSGSHHRTPEGSPRRPRRDSGLAAVLNGKKLREHRKERIVIVDSPPTPRTPPQHYNQVFTAPSSPASPPNAFDIPIRRSRPIIVDERPLRRERAPSVGAVVGDRLRARSQSRPRYESPGPSILGERIRRREEEERLAEEREERRRKRVEKEEREVEREAERRRAERIALQNEEILRRPAVPMPPRRLEERPYLRPVVDQSAALQDAIGALALEDRAIERAAEQAAERRRKDERERMLRKRLEIEKAAAEEEALQRRLKERQMPRRRFSVGPGHRRTRVVYDDGVYRWE